jgi:demethylmenaquinone methyltransferase/2-methoxy-6-polyprenyl-1,4-benzoquinol methylase
MTVLPYKNSHLGKKEQVRVMFNRIAWRYDLLNHLLSFNLDRWWRKKTIEMLWDESPKRILDIATGTGDMAFGLMKLKPDKVTGIDVSEKMIAIGKRKAAKKGFSDKVEFMTGDSEKLPFRDESFDAATVGFGVRNFENPIRGLKEIHRVIRKGGKLVILEFSYPDRFPFMQLYRFYTNHLLPKAGKLISGDASAYTYLTDSAREFPSGTDFVDYLSEAGFVNCIFKPLTFGVVTVYCGYKP